MNLRIELTLEQAQACISALTEMPAPYKIIAPIIARFQTAAAQAHREAQAPAVSEKQPDPSNVTSGSVDQHPLPSRKGRTQRQN